MVFIVLPLMVVVAVAVVHMISLKIGPKLAALVVSLVVFTLSSGILLGCLYLHYFVPKTTGSLAVALAWGSAVFFSVLLLPASAMVIVLIGCSHLIGKWRTEHAHRPEKK